MKQWNINVKHIVKEYTIGINVLKWCKTVGFLFVTKYVDWDNPHFTPGHNTNFVLKDTLVGKKFFEFKGILLTRLVEEITVLSESYKLICVKCKVKNLCTDKMNTLLIWKQGAKYICISDVK